MYPRCHCKTKTKDIPANIRESFFLSSLLISISSQSVFLVGGFAANTWLYSRIRADLVELGINLYRPDSHLYVHHIVLTVRLMLFGSNKAVADGAVSSFIDHAVTSRVSKNTYGVIQQVPYNRNDPEHVERLPVAFVDVSGATVLPNSFSVLLPKVYFTVFFLL